MLVVAAPAHACCCVQRPVQPAGVPQVFGTPAPPHDMPGPQIGAPAGQHVTLPPQPSAMKPQFCVPQVFFTQGGAPHTLGVPPPPQD